MDERFDRLDHRFDHMDERFDRIDQRFERMEQSITNGFEGIRWQLDTYNDVQQLSHGSRARQQARHLTGTRFHSVRPLE